MKRNPIFVYNNIDQQNLVYANQLTVKQWNDIINKLTAQANANTTFLETWTRWFFGPIEYTTEDEYTDSLGTYDSYYDYLKAEFNRIDARITGEVTRLDGRINEEIANREFQDTSLSNRIDQHEIVVENLSQDVNNRFATVNETLNKKINKDFSGLSVASSVHKEDTVIVRCAGCDGNEPVTYTLTVGALTELINSEVNYFKGYHSSFVALQEAHPTGEPGDYAFVATENDDQYHMYVWDEKQTPGRWEETISGQYALASSFAEFQQRLADGSAHVGAIKGNVSNASETDPLLVNIEINGNKYILPSLDLDFLGDAVEGAYKLGAIKINGDTWNVNTIELEVSDENVEGAYELGSMNINGNIWNVAKLSFVEEKIAELKAYLDANSFNKGEFLSLEKLQEKHPDAKPGEFAFVNTPTDQGDVMLMYVWDEDSKVWKETTSNQYVLTSVFENFKEEINKEINYLWDDVDALWNKGGGGVKSLFDIIRYDELTSEQIYEVPVLYKGNIPINPKKTQNIKGFYINKQLDNDAITILIAYMLLANDYINSVDPFINGTFNDDDFSTQGWFYFAEAYDEENDLYYDLFVSYNIDVDGQTVFLSLGCDCVDGTLDIWDNEEGWYSDAPDYVEMGVGFYANSNELGIELMSNIFSVDPFETYDFDWYHVDSSYYNMSIWTTPNWDGGWYQPWNKINGGSATSSSASAFVDVKSLETKIKSNVIPQTGEVGTLYFNTSLSNEEVIDIVSKLEIGENLSEYYILIAKYMECMFYVGLESQPTSELGEISSGSDYYIAARWENNTYILWHSAQGWDPYGTFGSDLENGIQLGIDLITPEELASKRFPADGHCGDQNDLLVSIVSTEKGNFESTGPKEVAIGDKDKVYRMIDSNGDYTYHQIKNDEWEYFGGNIIPVNDLTDAEKLVGTPITKYENAGPVTVYINKTLTNEQVQELCSKIYYDNSGRYYVCGHDSCIGNLMISDNSLQPTSIQGDIQHNYQIFAYDGNTDNYVDIWSTYDGWSDSCPDSVVIDTSFPMETSVEPLSEESAEEFVGKYNDQIKDLLSATPFKIGADKKAIYRVTKKYIEEIEIPEPEPMAVPTGGSGATFDKLYVNTSLTEQEMLEIFESLNYENIGWIHGYPYINIIHATGWIENDYLYNKNFIYITPENGYYVIYLYKFQDFYGSYEFIKLYTVSPDGPTGNEEFYGWNPNLSDIIKSDGSFDTEIVGTEAYQESTHNNGTYAKVGAENDKVIKLFYVLPKVEIKEPEVTYEYEYYRYIKNKWVKVLEESSSGLSNNYVEGDTLYLNGSNYSVDNSVLYMNDSSYVQDDTLYIISSSSGGSGGGSVNINIDTEMSDTSENPVQNKVIKAYIDNKTPNITIDTEMSDTSVNSVQNKVIKKYIDDTMQKKLTAGTGITISEDGVISISYPLAEEEEY